jgi:hypothetical protein
MHRSGTSALCAALNNSGINFGTGLLAAMAGVNDEGFWEDGELVALNDRLLAKAGCTWYSLGPLSVDIDWRAAQYEEERAAAQQIIERGFGVSPQAVKDPRFCLTLPFWLDVCDGMQREARVVCISRPPIEVARSLEKRDRFPLSFGLRLAEHYQRALETHIPESAVRLTFQELLTDPSCALAKLPPGWLGDYEARSEITAVRADLRHHNHSDDGDILSCPVLSLADVDRLREQLDKDYSVYDALNDMARVFTERGNELSKVGEAHTAALATLDQRDADIEALSVEHKQALATIAERDAQIAELDKRLAQAGAELEVAMATIEERDEQIAEFDRRLGKLGEEHSYALEVLRERDEQLERLRTAPGMGLAVRWMLSNEKS